MQTVNLIVNVFNGERYLAETLHSLVQQGYPYLYIHCIDNHSTDNTSEIIKDFKSKHSNVLSYMTPTHMPLVEARLFAISEVLIPQEKPFYFGFCDSDDLWAPDWVSKLMVFADRNYDLLISNGYYLEDQKTTPSYSCLSLLRPSPFRCPVSIQSCLISSNVIQDESPLFDTRFPIAYETEFWLRRGNELSYLHISDHLFYYRIHENSICKTNFFSILRERWDMLKLHKLSLIRFIYDLSLQLLTMMFSGK